MRLLLLSLFLCVAATAISAQTRVALVIGNGNYTSAPELLNPNADATEIGAALQRLGFTVLTRTDLSADGMRAAVRDFAVASEGADLALFYYAGHGIQLAGRNYLLPVDADIKREADVELSTIPLDLILGQMDRAAKTRVVFLDACRNNPFETRLARSMGQSRSAGVLGRGLAPIETDGGTFVGFATDPGEVAFDGLGRHSPFTASLLRHIERPGLEINALMTQVRADVYSETERLQRPWSSSSLLQEVFLVPAAPADTPDSPDDPRLADLAAWEAAQAAGDAAAYRGYLDAHPEGLFRQLAEAALADVEQTETAALVPLEQPTPPVENPEPVIKPRARASAETPPPQDPAPTPAPAEAAADCDVCPRTVRLPGGRTVLGSDRGGAEGPRTPQTIAPFELSAAEITVGEIRRFENATGRTIPRSCFVWTAEGRLRSRDGAYWGEPGYDVTFDHPASCLSWDDAQAYVDWLNTQDPRGGWRLPSEAEFEYAARAGTDTPYPWPGGADALCTQANGAGSESRFSHRNRTCSDGVEAPVPPGTFPANAFGLSHMIGNLWEWTEDCWNDTHRGATTDGAARTRGLCTSRVLRGGSWDDPPDNLRAAYRVGIPKTRRQSNVGFRVARDAQ